MLFTWDVVIGAPGHYFSAGHKALLLIGLIVLVALFVVLRIFYVRRHGRRGRW